MKTLVALFVFVFSTLTFAQAAPTIYGQWSLPAFTGNGIVINMHLAFAPGLVTAIADCQGFGQSAESRVSAPADITGNVVSVKANAQHTEVVGGLQCDASLTVGSINYQVSQNNEMLELSAQGNSLTLTRDH